MLLGDLSKSHEEWTDIIKNGKGSVLKTIKSGVRFIIATPDAVVANQVI